MVNNKEYIDIEKLNKYFTDTSVEIIDDEPVLIEHYSVKDMYFLIRNEDTKLSVVGIFTTDDEKRSYLKKLPFSEQYNYLLDFLEENI